MKESSSQGMFDGRFVVSLVLILACWMGWQAYMAKKYPAINNKKAPKATETIQTGTSVGTPTTATGDLGTSTNNGPRDNGRGSGTTAEAVPAGRENQEVITRFEDEVWSFQISSRGMALKNIVLKKNFLRTGQPVSFADKENDSLFGTGIMGHREPLNFKVSQPSREEFVGVFTSQGMTVTKILHIDSARNILKVRVKAEGLSPAIAGFYTDMSEGLTATTDAGSFLSPNSEHQGFFVFHDGQISRIITSADKEQSEAFSQTKIVGFGTQYFAFALVDQSPVIPEFRETTASGLLPRAFGVLNYSLLNRANELTLEYTCFAGPKSYELLKSIDPDLSKMVDFGFFHSIAKSIFWLMRAIHATVGNWGVAIILLTILIRVAVLPFNLVGYKQMKAMTKIQPEMKLLREKYKNDPQKMNQETLALMKQAKANPLGGCLPMLLQIPVFFALYQVIGQSIELYQAPFIFWIKDLSFKDPFYVLPALMGITMFVQQKITPSAMDPAQQKVMLFLPVIFTFFMIGLPSGLTLYIFISSVFGVLQQIYFMKEKNAVTA